MVFSSGILIGLSTFLLVTHAYTVEVDVDNAVQIIKKIIVQTLGGSTGTVIDGNTINTVNMEAFQYCDESGANCVDIADVSTGWVGLEIDPVFNAHSGDYYTTGQSDNKYLTGELWTENWSDIYYNAGKVGINTTTPSENLEVDGTGKLDTIIIWDTNVATLYMSGTELVIED